MSSKKKTAVEWLIGDLNQKIDFIPMDKWDMIRDIIQQAKAMEKEQIMDAFEECWKENMPEGYECKQSAEYYYKETYGQ